MIIFTVLWFAIIIFEIAAIWIVFRKAAQPGWGSIIPIYNCYLWLQMANRPAWWLILLLIPVVNLVVAIILCLDVAKAFGKSTAFGIVLVLFGFIGFPILAFGSSSYTRPVRAAA